MTSEPLARRTLAYILPRLGGRNLLSYGGALTVRGLEVVGKFGLYAMAASRLGVHDSGLFFLCITWTNLASTAARLGLERATIRHVAAEIAVGRGLAARRAAINSFVAVTLASLVGAGLTVLAAAPAARMVFHQPELAHPLALSAAIIPAQTMTWATAFVLVGLKRGVAAQLILSALPPGLSLLALCAGLNNTDLLLLAYTVSFSACGLIGLGLIVRDGRSKWRDRPAPPGVEPEPLGSLWAEARPFFIVELTQTTVISLPTLLLGSFAPAHAVSEFSIASRLSNLVNTVVISIGTIAAASFAEHHRLGDSKALRRVDRQARLLTWLLSLPIVTAMMVAPGFLLRLLGSEFGAAWFVLMILALGQLINCLLPFQDTLLAMTENGVILRRLNLLQLATCIVLGLLLIPPFGMVGAAITSTIVLVLYVVGCKLAVLKAIR